MHNELESNFLTPLATLFFYHFIVILGESHGKKWCCIYGITSHNQISEIGQ